jgi:hypothetical protein
LPNGCGISDWNWGISWNQRPHASPSLLLPSRSRTRRLPRVPPYQLLLLDMAHLPRPRPGKRVASRGKIFLSSLMERCAAKPGTTLTLQEQRQEANGSLRLVYAASIRRCRSCELREQCQWNGSVTKKPRQVSVLLHPLAIGPAPLLWRDWSRREHRRACIQLARSHRVEIQVQPDFAPAPEPGPVPLSRAARAHFRLSWEMRLARNARVFDGGLRFHQTLRHLSCLCCFSRPSGKLSITHHS